MKVFILHKKFVENKKIIIGGIETYIRNLCDLFNDLGWGVVVAQPDDTGFEYTVDGINVVGVPCGRSKHNYRRKLLANWALGEADYNNDIIIFAADWYSVPIDYQKVISIQHGISWDLPSKSKNIFSWLLKAREQYSFASKFENSKYKVCVDYNFLNWYRACRGDIDESSIEVIPNFSKTHEYIDMDRHLDIKDGIVRILFARRMVSIRGTRIMADACSFLLGDKKRNIEITFAGDGPDELFLKQRFAGDSRVKFIHYHPSDSSSIHQQSHIAVIPSIGSEGTSLSLIEAMAAGCAVICSNVGGMTNLVIDGFNGLLIKPDAMSLSGALVKMIEDEQFRYELAVNSLSVARKSFSLNKWRYSWKEYIEKICHSS
ncbi:glycosyltransferase family 4 protein [Aeromonas sobria]|uniref:glycosyltransferase family 4 protein n=1 Tax=Aeromonas sobria TaxID=646 RepID=UPI000C6D6235|nr:glycosyltransferase family 4 protein [Aeromonas sobria]PKQ71753.1 hypothetical protein CJF47_20340 [Aeromonas sobria]